MVASAAGTATTLSTLVNSVFGPPAFTIVFTPTNRPLPRPIHHATPAPVVETSQSARTRGDSPMSRYMNILIRSPLRQLIDSPLSPPPGVAAAPTSTAPVKMSSTRADVSKPIVTTATSETVDTALAAAEDTLTEATIATVHTARVVAAADVAALASSTAVRTLEDTAASTSLSATGSVARNNGTRRAGSLKKTNSANIKKTALELRSAASPVPVINPHASKARPSTPKQITVPHNLHRQDCRSLFTRSRSHRTSHRQC